MMVHAKRQSLNMESQLRSLPDEKVRQGGEEMRLLGTVSRDDGKKSKVQATIMMKKMTFYRFKFCSH